MKITQLDSRDLEIKQVLDLICEFIVTQEARDIFLDSLKEGFSLEESRERLSFFRTFQQILTYYPEKLPYPSYLPQKHLVILLEKNYSSQYETFSKKDLFILYQNLSLAEKLKSKKKEFEKKELKDFFSLFYSLSFWLEDVEKYFNIKERRIKEDATPTLKKLYQSLRRLEEEREKVLKKLLSSFGKQNLLTDDIYVYRDEKFLFPFKVGEKISNYGVYHGVSRSGATVYVEPYQIIELNNRYREIEFKIEEEVERILSLLTAKIFAAKEEVLTNLRLLYIYDVSYGIGRYALKYQANDYLLKSVEDDYLYLKDARHPLLGNKAIPITIEKERGKRGIVISGVNAGGKTVTLKTLALFSFLAAAGIPLPLNPDSQLLYFEGIYSLLGGEQGIQNNLSGFTAYLSRLKDILRNVQKGDLVLLDELGEGTDPEQGEALAIGVMEYLIEKGATFVITTHFYRVKNYSFKHKYLIHYSVHFDERAFQPTFELRKGLMGNSFGLEIAQKYGIPYSVIKRAKKILGPSYHKKQKVLKRIEESYQIIKNEQNLAHSLRVDLQEKLWEKEKELEKLQQEAQQEIFKLKNEFSVFIEEVKQQIKDKLKSIRKGKGGEGLEKEYSRLQNLVSRLSRDAVSQLEDKEKELFELKRKSKSKRKERDFSLEEKKGISSSERQSFKLEKGKWVVTFSGIEGEVKEILPNGKVIIIDNGIEWRIKQKDISLVKEKVKTSSSSQVNFYTGSGIEKQQIKQELDLRGLTAEEAEGELDRFFARVLLSDWKRVYIIHGKGTGKLRQMVENYLKKADFISSYRLGGVGEGGSGVTVVDL